MLLFAQISVTFGENLAWSGQKIRDFSHFCLASAKPRGGSRDLSVGDFRYLGGLPFAAGAQVLRALVRVNFGDFR